MALTKSRGNMYPWVSHTHAHLGGQCPHDCKYCFVDHPRFGRAKKYTGELRLISEEFAVKYGIGRTIFVEHCNDLFAAAVPAPFILSVLEHCARWPHNTYVFQSKNPGRYHEFLSAIPRGSILGTTIETNRVIPGVSVAPAPAERHTAMVNLAFRKFVTIEPILDFDVDPLAEWITQIRPEFLNIGADSKQHDLPEPSAAKVLAFMAALKALGIEVREKHNLQRLLPNS
jgi:hypothetical protein